MPEYLKNPSITEKKMGHQRVLYDPENNTIYSLNLTAGIIWDSCAHECPEEKIISDVNGNFLNPPESVEADVKETLAKLCSLGLLQCKN